VTDDLLELLTTIGAFLAISATDRHSSFYLNTLRVRMAKISDERFRRHGSARSRSDLGQTTIERR
jgi:hypothetical protein